MKTWQIDLRKVLAMTQSQGTIRARIDADVQPRPARSDPDAPGEAPTTVLTFDEETARVLVLLLRAQLAEFDSRKARSRRG